MKISLKFLVTLTFLLSSGVCDAAWFPILVDYVKEKGRDVKNYYVETVHPKMKSYLGLEQDQNHTINGGRITNDELTTRSTVNYFLKADSKKGTTDKSLDEAIYTEKCSYNDYTVQLNVTELIALDGYPFESHTAVTTDGYILTVHRIPYSKTRHRKQAPRKTVLLHHGLLGSSADWIIAGPNKGLAYILSDAGYDVWLANVRGNTYSRAHVSRSVDSYAFWNFTFHEVSQYDLPAVIDYIMEVKRWDVKINYVGHSMGTTVLFALLSTKPEYNKILRAGFALAPVAYMSEIRSPLRILTDYGDYLAYMMDYMGLYALLQNSPATTYLIELLCNVDIEIWHCENLLFMLLGYNPKQLNKCLIPFVLHNTPAGASTKTFLHYAQEIKTNGTFQQFDFEEEGNIQQYGDKQPPKYPVHNITLPIALFSAENDLLSSVEDAKKLKAQLQNPIAHYVVPLKEFNHIDFLWAKNAKTLVYDKLLQLMEKQCYQTDKNYIDKN